MRLAAIKNGVVENVIEATTENRYAASQHLEGNGYTVVVSETASPGDTWDGNDFARPPKPIVKQNLTHRQFLKRLTAQEFKSIRQAANNNPDVDMFLYLFERAQEIDLADPDTLAGVQMLESAGLLANGRAAEILA